MKNKKQATLKSIAEHVGVSITTVSRVLSGQARRYRISEKTEDTILRTAEQFHYTPNHIARGLRLKRTFTLGLVIPDISNPFFAHIAKSISIEARKKGYSIILCDSLESTKLEIEFLQLLQSRKVDGFIICPVGQQSKHLEQLYNRGVKMVIIDRVFEQLKCPRVLSDNYHGALKAVSYFIENGHTIIGSIQGLHDTSVNQDRIQGYRDALKMHNLPVDESLIVGDSFGDKNGYISAKLLLNREIRPTAIFAFSNLISLGIIRAISEEKLEIPDDISLISFDDQPYSDHLSTPLTTIRQHSFEMGEIACKLLINQIEKDNMNNTNSVVLPTELIIRKSVKRIFPLNQQNIGNKLASAGAL